MLVFFDVLCVDGESFVDQPYEARRAKLERTVRCVPGFTMVASQTKIPLNSGNPIAALESLFARHIADYEG